MTPFRIPVRQLAWATDLHLVFVPGGTLHAFCESLAQTSADAIAITGDISDGRRLGRHLSLIAGSVQKPIFVLLGNHDRYHTSFADAEEQVQRVVEIHPHIHRLTGSEVIELNARSALVGVDGWADGQSGSGPASPIVLNDTVLIDDLATLSRAAGWKRISELSCAFAATIKPTLNAAMSSYREVILLTHRPAIARSDMARGRHLRAGFSAALLQRATRRGDP